MPRPPKSELTETGAYRPELIEFALTTYAVEGNAARAARLVKEQFGTGPSSNTVIDWARNLYAHRFAQIRENEADSIKRRVATRVEDLLERSLDVQEQALDKAAGDIAKLDPKDSAGALRNIATSAGILATNLREMRPKDPILVEHTLNADDLLRKLAGFIPQAEPPSIEGTAVEIPPDLPQGPGQADGSEAVSGA